MAVAWELELKIPQEHIGQVLRGFERLKTDELDVIFIVRSDPQLTEEAVAEYCKKEFTNYKRPKYIQFRDELPKTNVGKILRRELRNL